MNKEIDYVAEEKQKEAKLRYDSRQESRNAILKVYDTNKTRIIQGTENDMRDEIERTPNLTNDQRLDIANKWNESKLARLEQLKKDLEASGFKENELTIGDLAK